VRKARIANSKTMSAYNKALKAAGDAVGAAHAAPVTPATAGVAAPVLAAAAPSAAGIAPPKLIEITDDMSPDDVRKARIANSKATSAYNKALKEAGYDPAAAAAPAVEQVPTTPVPAAPALVAAPATASATAASIAPPQLVEITDSMSPEEIRRARVENSKAMSTYNKALKAAGIDPASVK
jgi:hypothetical protein